jgi:phage terminase Nu1 subunit (DNA packaging protein)
MGIERVSGELGTRSGFTRAFDSGSAGGGGSDVIITTAELAKEFGRTDRYIRNLVKFGMPREAHGKFELEVCWRWYVRYLQDKLNHGGGDPKPEDGDQNQPNAEIERALLIKAQREQAEHNLAQVRGAYVPVVLYEKTMGAQIAVARQLLLTLPARIAHELEGQPRPVIKDILVKRIHAGLLALSQVENFDGAGPTNDAGS